VERGFILMKLKEVFLGAGSMLQGSGAYIYLMLPENWRIMPSYIPPEASLLKVINGNPWIIIGNTSATIVAEDAKQLRRPIQLKVKVDDRKHPKNLVEWLSQEKEKIGRNSNASLRDAGKVEISKHQGAYVVWVENKKRFGVFGQQHEEASILCAFQCEDTNREIIVRLWTEYPDVLLGNKTVLKRILCSIACHDRIGGEEEEQAQDESPA
jgi:hypothetical protein